jgi:hypothetical protein
MPKKAAKKAAKKKPKKASKAKATKARGATAREGGARRRKAAAPREHLSRAHRAVLRVVESVTADDADAIARLRRAVDHAHDNARASGRKRQ